MAIEDEVGNRTSPVTRTDDVPVEEILLGDREHFVDGPPHAIFKRLRSECPVHWTPPLREWPGEEGSHSVPPWDDGRTVSMAWQTYSSEVGGTPALTHSITPLEMQRGMFIAQDPP